VPPVAGRRRPNVRTVQGPELGRVVALPKVGGLHRRYERKAGANASAATSRMGFSATTGSTSVGESHGWARRWGPRSRGRAMDSSASRYWPGTEVRYGMS
jgi:hypothetical protein